MRLAAKLILIFLVGVFAVVSLFAWQTIQRQHAWEQQRREAHAHELVETLQPALQSAYRNGGRVTIQQAVEISTEQLNGPRIRWIDGREVASPPPKAIARSMSRVSVTDEHGTRTAYSYVPLNVDGENLGTVEVSQSMSEQDSFVRDSVYASILSLIGVAGLSAVVIYYGGIELVGKPLGKLIEQVNLIGEGKLDQSPVLSGKDELGRLAVAISQMSHRLSDQRDTIRHTDRLGTIGTLAAGVAHELGTPLNVVSGRAGLIASGKLSEQEIASSARTIKSESERMTAIIRQLLDFARQTPSPHDSIDLTEILTRTCDLMRPLARKSDVEIALHATDRPTTIAGDAAQVQQVLTNLISNAIGAMPDGGTVTVSIDVDEPTEMVWIEVRDTGVGIPSEQLNHVFEPFYTTKDVGEGTGLGLSIAYGIVREHAGEIKVDSEPGCGTTFRIRFPMLR
ncbi:Sporulation kinase E [Novipirellula galeiformis]|uniref:histidine kinase n=1 Tax=Novipirellula galeiformis TaxID=2528004 RepID=A0A5C6CBZ1_9BACT|nr:sensor histidine kinase [Novipirellula galeiformis]TWU21758.1 Sporulation kinase E [Novipirellula galeiformis]